MNAARRLRGGLRTRPVRGPGLQEPALCGEPCRPRALTRRFGRAFNRSPKKNFAKLCKVGPAKPVGRRVTRNLAGGGPPTGFGTQMKLEPNNPDGEPRMTRMAWMQRNSCPKLAEPIRTSPQSWAQSRPAHRGNERRNRSADFSVCCIADFQSAARPKSEGALACAASAGWKHRDTAGWETCATTLSTALPTTARTGGFLIRFIRAIRGSSFGTRPHLNQL